MNINPRLSIITPVYNSFHLMKKGLSAIEKMPNKSIELILVDDCSTDNSFSQLIEYASKSNQIVKVIQNEKNSGPGVARNNGIINSTCDYLTFMDSDDFLSDNFFDSIFPLLNKNFDCIVYDALIYKENEKLTLFPMLYNEKNEGIINVKETIMNIKTGTLGKIYKKSIIIENDINFLAQNRSEDAPFTISVVAHCSSIYYCKKALYYYVQQSESITHNRSYDDIDSMNCAFEYIKEKIKSKYPIELEALYARLVLYYQSRQISCYMTNEQLSNWIDVAKSKYPNCLDNPYFQQENFKIKFIVRLCMKKRINMIRLINKLQKMIK